VFELATMYMYQDIQSDSQLIILKYLKVSNTINQNALNHITLTGTLGFITTCCYT